MKAFFLCPEPLMLFHLLLHRLPKTNLEYLMKKNNSSLILLKEYMQDLLSPFLSLQIVVHVYIHGLLKDPTN